VFIDYGAIPLGIDFMKYIENAIENATCVLAIIGPQWLGPLLDGSARIDDPADPVRIELETALRRGVRIIPLLVDGAKMPARSALPASLADVALLNAAEVDAGIDFEAHVRRLVRSIDGSIRSSGNVPKRLPLLIGRSFELATIQSYLADCAIVTVTGTGGIGKTRIALAVANALRGTFADGVWFVDLAAIRTAGLVAQEIAGTLAIQRAAEDVPLEAVVEHLRDRKALLVVDNCEHLVEEAARVLQLLANSCAGIVLLTTSREVLNIAGERVYRLPPLSVAAAGVDVTAENALQFGSVALFAERAAAAYPDFVLSDATAPIVSEICRRLDGIPLAIELAAARATVFRVAEIRDRLNERFRILTQGRRTALPRQQTMRATIDWSYDLLEEGQRCLFRSLSVFVNGFSFAAASAVGGDDSHDFDIFEDLASLVARSLVLTEPAGDDVRYRLLESTREYALEKLHASSEHEAASRRFAAWCLTFVERAHQLWETAPSRDWLSIVEPEFDNLREGLTWALEQRAEPALGLRITAGARRLWGRLAPVEGKRWTQLALQAVEPATPRELVASLYLTDAHIHVALQEYKRALESAELARSRFDQREDPVSYWQACEFAGYALAMLGRPLEAEPLIAQALTAYRLLGAQQLIASGLVGMALFLQNQENLQAAREHFSEALLIFKELQNERGSRSVMINLAEIEFRGGNVEAAIANAESAFSIGDDDVSSVYLVNMAAYLVAGERWEKARERARQCILRASPARTDTDTALALQHLAAVCALRPSTNVLGAHEDRCRAARLIGFVDGRLAALEVHREFTEQYEYERILGALGASLAPETYQKLRAEGGSWSESRALVEAKLV